MTVKDLRAKHIEVFGERTRSGHKDYLVKRIAWRMQANDGGTLGTGEYDLFTYDTFPDTFTAPTIYYGNTGWSNATVALDETGRRIYLKFGRPGDTNEDGVVDAADFITLKKNFGKSVGGGAPATAPEPATLGLLAIGALAVVRRRRRA